MTEEWGAVLVVDDDADMQESPPLVMCYRGAGINAPGVGNGTRRSRN